MSMLVAVVAVLALIAALITLGMVLEAAPGLIRAAADARLVREHGASVMQGAGWSDHELGVALLHAVRRTDPNLPDELAQRFAQSVLEDLAAGLLEGLEEAA